MSIDALIRAARAGQAAPLSVLSGPERIVIDRAVAALKRAAVGEGIAGFNDDLLNGHGLTAQRLINTARTVPMLSERRFVLVRGADAIAADEQDGLVEYVKNPAPHACVVLVAEKLDARGKLGKAAREAGVYFEAESPRAPDMPMIAQSEAEVLGHALDPAAAAALADALGADFSGLIDALERLSLYVGEGKPIREADVEACIAHVRTESVWALVDAVGARNPKVALGAAASLLADREPPLRILALVARQLRTLARMRSGLSAGLRPQEAAQKAGAPPFKAQELARLAGRFDGPSLARAFAIVGQADLDLKGSRVAGPRVLERALLELCS